MRNNKDSEHYKLSVLLRLIMNHFHLIGIILSYNFNWPSSIQAISSTVEIVFSVNTTLISFDCL